MICHRCNNSCRSMKMSIFNTQMLCDICQETEKEHPRYEEAVKKEFQEVLKGNYSYSGLAIEEGFEETFNNEYNNKKTKL